MTCCPAPKLLGTPAASEGPLEAGVDEELAAGFAPLTCTFWGQLEREERERERRPGVDVRGGSRRRS